jgi:transcriptional regulator with XRE-family HTH domain
MAGKIADQVDLAIGQKVRRFRQTANLSQVELGERIGASSEQIQKYES